MGAWSRVSRSLGTKKTSAFFALWVLLVSHPALAWGPLGHRMVAETAALLIENEWSRSSGAPSAQATQTTHTTQKAWGELLARHRFELGYYSMLPDALFRHLDGHDGKVESPTHFLDLDLLFKIPNAADLKWDAEMRARLDQMPSEFLAAQKWILAQVGAPAYGRLGTVPWRAEQYAEHAKKTLASMKVLSGTYERGQTAKGDNRALFEGMQALGVMSHYTGDATMPYHATVDWNGYATGNGGIHFYFESDCVNALEPGLSQEVWDLARKDSQKWLTQWAMPKAPSDRTPAELVLRALAEAGSEIREVASTDTKKAILKPSQGSAFAVRKTASEACGAFRERLIQQIARGAVLTAELWKRALPLNIDASHAQWLQFSDLAWTTRYLKPQRFEVKLPKFKEKSK